MSTPATSPGWLAAFAAKHGPWVVLAGFLLWRDDARRGEEAKERREVLAQLVTAVTDLKRGIDALAIREQDHADAVRLSWPQLRPPRFSRIASAAPTSPEVP